MLLISLPLSGVAAQTIHAAEIAAASQRFGIPEAWIRAVLRAESAGDRHAVSHRGAMGLMQVVPATWASLRAQHGLGADPFVPQDNILAGTAYLREMLDRFGSVPLMLAAYNAGPRRVEAHLSTGQPLPAETRAYVATLAPLLTGDSGTAAPGQIAVQAARGAEGIFVRLRGVAAAGPPTSARSIFVSVAGTTTAAATAIVQPFVGRDRAADAQDVDGPAGDRGSIFAIRRSAGGAQ
ncbi:lytic transglycosylase domain-containing protein [Paeniroseomonas aquatica]|uniref:Lytic transglycosylase domain-containing protein n=1 Tax=Paeniroseomonas aquatica TaxID=373043 RepID=A0ABT8A1T4_9PROT|nr:lytic transglycosylase domain-containing protein [Paeniroseomonas aquatica]MDN3563700.1 lytic transglycosylase domain-containing protein [Paeniroseomonas aquatica]